MTKLLFHSNAPWAPTGYGQQGAYFAPKLAEHYDLAYSAFYGLEGAPITWEGMKILPGLGGTFGNEELVAHAKRFFGDLRGGLVLTLFDVHTVDPEVWRSLNLACWCPVDHEPAPPDIVNFLFNSGAIPIAMTRFGQRQLGRLDPLYVPHGIDTKILRPYEKESCRKGAFPKGAFVVGMVAANKGRPSRKGFPQALEAFKRFSDAHDNAFLYLHTVIHHGHGQGENIPALLQQLDIDVDRVRFADQYAMMLEPYRLEDMAQVYGSLDVLLAPSLGEGFGVPIMEAQACGRPAIVTDGTAMTEVCRTGWKVGHHPYWTGLSSWQTIPKIDEIYDALEECYALSDKEREMVSASARQGALEYDVDHVFDEYMLPAMRVFEQRVEARKPITIPSRLKVAA